MQTTYPLRIQAIRSKGQQPRLYISVPLALAAAIGLEAGELVQWELLDRGELHLVRQTTPPPKTRPSPKALTLKTHHNDRFWQNREKKTSLKLARSLYNLRHLLLWILHWDRP